MAYEPTWLTTREWLTVLAGAVIVILVFLVGPAWLATFAAGCVVGWVAHRQWARLQCAKCRLIAWAWFST